jgi:hypothetical protein
MAANPPSNITQPIDAVIAWVDGNDPVLKEKRESFLNDSGSSNMNSAVLPTHFASNDEIKYCVLSILRFASFVRNIYIVTDGQDPGLNDIIEANYPERKDSVRIVDHKEIFEGYEEYLPTFNSISIGNMVWRIKGLSDNFVYFNDDVILIQEHKPEDWFINNRPVLRGKWLFPPLKKILRIKLKSFLFVKLGFRPTYHPRISFYILQWKVARLLGMKFRYYFICHTPHPLRRSNLDKFFDDNRKMMEKNISSRFRNRDQILMSSLAYHLELKSGNRNTSKLNLEYIHPTYSTKRLYRKIERSENNPKTKSVAIQSVDMFSEVEQENIFRWLDRLMGLQKNSINDR